MKRWASRGEFFHGLERDPETRYRCQRKGRKEGLRLFPARKERLKGKEEKGVAASQIRKRLDLEKKETIKGGEGERRKSRL